MNRRDALLQLDDPAEKVSMGRFKGIALQIWDMMPGRSASRLGRTAGCEGVVHSQRTFGVALPRSVSPLTSGSPVVRIYCRLCLLLYVNRFADARLFLTSRLADAIEGFLGGLRFPE